MTTEQSAQELNRDVVQRVFDAVELGDALHNENFTLELNWGHPDSGAERRTSPGRARSDPRRSLSKGVQRGRVTR